MNDTIIQTDWFPRILKSEGGINRTEPKSVGGVSSAGISKDAYGEWLKVQTTIENPPETVEELLGDAVGTEWEKASPLEIPKEYGVRLDVIIAFYNDYFKMAWLDILPKCLEYIHADFFTNARFNANKVLQRMVGFTGKAVDGILGPASRERLSELKAKLEADMEVDPTADDDLIMEYHNQKLEHYESLKGENLKLYNANIRGWRKRAQHILGELEDYFYDENPTTSALSDEASDLGGLFAHLSPDTPEETPAPPEENKQAIIDQIAELLQRLV